ncbi:hypothetical protein HMPREF3190_01205 [Umbribacter vaginalis]|nr:hypothetical protein HMPREF3190_01205 [Coriobacteriales bacterium DNF00809]
MLVITIRVTPQKSPFCKGLVNLLHSSYVAYFVCHMLFILYFPRLNTLRIRTQCNCNS